MEYFELFMIYAGVFSAGGLSTFLTIHWIISSSKRDANPYSN